MRRRGDLWREDKQATMSGRNGDISLLVQQLKSGQISKSELFNHLVVIHQSRTAPDAGPGAQAPSVPASNAFQQTQALQASHAHQAARCVALDPAAVVALRRA